MSLTTRVQTLMTRNSADKAELQSIIAELNRLLVGWCVRYTFDTQQGWTINSYQGNTYGAY